ncbi:MAG: HAD family phosphatase [Butyrivibrio sp.]|nr:HAD family phosphatase [Acetatifactor muris]MCM1558194.1 HAD family phosphatase [Butyrivibrio sp.]
MIKNVIFDMGQVLIYFSPELYINRLGVSGEDCEILLREVFRRVEWVRLDHGTITEAEAVESICRRVPDRLHRAVEELVYRWWDRPLNPVPGMKELIAEIKELGCGIYLLSNANIQQCKYHDRIPGTEYFDGRIVSAECKLIKPQREIYELLLTTYGLSADECLFIDDSPLNVEGAYCAGIRGIVFDGDLPRLRRELREAGVMVEV